MNRTVGSYRIVEQLGEDVLLYLLEGADRRLALFALEQQEDVQTAGTTNSSVMPAA